MDFIFMLTRDDRTVADGLELLDQVRDAGIRHIGFKDIGVDPATLAALTAKISEIGAVSYLEVVSTAPADARMSARLAVEIGIDCLLGGTEVEATLDIVLGSGIEYYPFAGFPEGHPTHLRGTAADIAGHCRAYLAQGCAGVDLLAYRALEEDPLSLVRAAREALKGGRLIVAGSINGPAQITELAAAGADAFTIGTAVFNGAFGDGVPALGAQLARIKAACA